MANKTYMCIDLKSFYASVECVERGLDPLTTNLVVADKSRTSKTICLAVTPSLKAEGINGRPRLFEVMTAVDKINAARKIKNNNKEFSGSSFNAEDLKNNLSLKLDYIAAPPRMAFYIKHSTKIYNIYLKYVAPEDIHVYSIDEVFMDITNYLKASGLNAHEFAKKIALDVLNTTGITATVGIGTNLFLAKIAMDIVSKHIPTDKDGVRIAELDEKSYKEKLWSHRPITDFWRVGKGYAKKLEKYGIYTMGDIALCSLGNEEDFYNEKLLFDLFGVNAELLIDHAWGFEPCTISDIKSYKPQSNSLGSGQVLHEPYDFEGTRLVIKEMLDMLCLDLVDKGLATNQITLTVGYDVENLLDPKRAENYCGQVKIDAYGRRIPKHTQLTINLKRYTSSSKRIIDYVLAEFDDNVNTSLLVRRINISANHVISEKKIPKDNDFEQLNLFTNHGNKRENEEQEEQEREREKQLQETMLDIKKRFGKNAILKGMNLKKGATAKDKNSQIGGHRA